MQARNLRKNVLIGTLWNVNVHTANAVFCPRQVLIGTLWNVNWQQQKNLNPVPGFNRYIVECKSV